jgi:hypothetical protein
MMRFFPLTFVFLAAFSLKASAGQITDIFHERIEAVAGKFTNLDVPDLEKIQIPQAQADGSYIFVYVWFPITHRPTTASFEANVGDYFDVIGAQHKTYAGWCYVRKPEAHTLKTANGEIGVMRIWAAGYYGNPPREKCQGGRPGKAGALGQTKVFKDPNSGLLSMVRNGHPTRFPLVEKRIQ